MIGMMVVVLVVADVEIVSGATLVDVAGMSTGTVVDVAGMS